MNNYKVAEFDTIEYKVSQQQIIIISRAAGYSFLCLTDGQCAASTELELEYVNQNKLLALCLKSHKNETITRATFRCL